MLIENTEVYGWRATFRGMRNPRNSWDEADSCFDYKENLCFINNGHFKITVPECPSLGPKDLDLAIRLIKNSEPHCKFLRYIFVWTDFVLPRYAWQDVDTYKVATVRNSCSTRYEPKIRDFERSDFEIPEKDDQPSPYDVIINLLNIQRRGWVNGNAKGMIRMKKLLPESYLQRATYLINYSGLLNMVIQRYNHPLSEFNAKVPGSICNWILSLPYMKEFYEAALIGKIEGAERAKLQLNRFHKDYLPEKTEDINPKD